jgi:2'-5' RNA ligase
MRVARAGENRARLFFALWPDEGVRSALAAAAHEAQAQAGGRAVSPEKIHLTLFFIGSTGRARVPAIEALGASLRSSPFELVLDTLGYWRRNGIVWCGAARCPEALARLAADLCEALAREGVRAEERPYVPHVTLVRDAARAPRNIAFAPSAWRAREFVLVESAPDRGSVRYMIRARWPL